MKKVITKIKIVEKKLNKDIIKLRFFRKNIVNNNNTIESNNNTIESIVLLLFTISIE